MMIEDSGKSVFTISSLRRGFSEAAGGVKTIAGFWKSFLRDNEKRKRDPFTPAIRTKGEKARNRHKRMNRQ